MNISFINGSLNFALIKYMEYPLRIELTINDLKLSVVNHDEPLSILYLFISFSLFKALCVLETLLFDLTSQIH